MNQIKTVFGFDMETDIGSWTSFYEGFKHGTPLILDVLKKHDFLLHRRQCQEESGDRSYGAGCRTRNRLSHAVP